MSSQTAIGWLTPPLAAPLLGVSRATVWRWASRGVIPPEAVTWSGRAVRIARWWIEARKEPLP